MDIEKNRRRFIVEDILTDDVILGMKDVSFQKIYRDEAERWDFLIGSLVLNDAFLHEFIMLTSRFAQEDIKTMGVHIADNMIQLVYSPSFLAKLTDAEARWVILHEALHIVLHHCSLRQSVDPTLHALHNIAADMAINQLLPLDSGIIKRPRKEVINIILPEMYSFPADLSLEQYFQMLLKKYDPNDPDNQPQEKGDGDNQDGEGGPGGEGDPQDGEGSGKGSGKKPYEKGDLVDNHDGWGDTDIGTMDSIIRNAVEQFQQSGQKWGNISGGDKLKNMILAAQKSQVKWYRLLRHYIGNLVSTSKTATMKRPNRRYGYPFSGTKRSHVDKILVCGDASASVSDKAWGVFLTELNTLAEMHPVDLVIFDTKILYGPKEFNRKVKKLDVPGRGGTDFKDIFDLAVKGKYQSVVVLTDGEASEVPYPAGVKNVIWCLVGESDPCCGKVNWGKRVRVKEDLF